MRAGCVQIVVSPQKNFAGGTELRIVSKALPILFHGGSANRILDLPELSR